MRALFATALTLLLPPALTACGSGGAQTTSNYYAAGPTSTVRTTPAPAKMNRHGTQDVSGRSSVKVEMSDFFFSPTIIEATPGQKLTLELSNRGTVEHNVTIASQGVDLDIPPRKTVDVQVTLPGSGLVAFYCKYHTTRGMAGELLVRQPAFTG